MAFEWGVEDCTFCRELDGNLDETNYGRLLGMSAPSRLIWSDAEWAVLPSLGPLADTHLLVIPREHRISFSHLSEDRIHRADFLLSRIATTLRRRDASEVVIFEHGCLAHVQTACEVRRNRLRSGACTDHAHMHVIQGVGLHEINRNLQVLGPSERLKDLKSLKSLVRGVEVYLIIGNPTDGKVDWSVHIVDFLPSQFMRQLIAAVTHTPGFWDWRRNPRPDKVIASVRELGPHVRAGLYHSTSDAPTRLVGE